MAPALLGWAAPLPLGGEGDTVTLVSQMEKKGLEKASEMPKVTQGHGGRGKAGGHLEDSLVQRGRSLHRDHTFPLA
ncbi:hypothetical protein Y1Q_0000206 [Alligator mississippiensis]|uniref:Uncharacterized protein n=1 Tax=Alligator mississippiensis TaxID=8496 RepID=A0A151MP41_ALLMI|nr:hypothetical protein Y1Q_0000206 [Alligator mississippiensis]